ncbi:MAG: threonine synthase [Kiritimatiellia bacterium]
MEYVSTRGKAPRVNSIQALLNGLAPDGGLYVPATALAPLPSGQTFRETMEALLERFFDDLPASIRTAAISSALERFRVPSITPLHTCGSTQFLELFHGPTYAFKDIALTLLPHLMKAAAEIAAVGRVCVLTATSGDTGSAAMAGFADVENTSVLVFYPRVGTSEIQRRQMVCCPGANVSACAIEGNFDMAQAAVKAAFANPTLAAQAKAQGVMLSSANSINIGRLFPQICYYLDTARQLGRPFDVVVPTGNFGNILAAHYAKELGAPIERLVVASNVNRVVCDFVRDGRYARRLFEITNSPSMDILVSSNVERMLWKLAQGRSSEVAAWEQQLKADGAFTLPADPLQRLHSEFASGWATPQETEAAIRDVWEAHHYLVDPHTAIGWKVARALGLNAPVIVATASPWKFPVTMVRALTGETMTDEFAASARLSALTGEVAALTELQTAPILHTGKTTQAEVPQTIARTFGW